MKSWQANDPGTVLRAVQAVAGVLGYNLKNQATVLPAAIIDLLPSGPALDPAAAG